MRAFLKEPDALDNDMISAMIVGARQYIEQYLNRALLTQTMQATFRGPATFVTLPRPPLQALTAIDIIDADDGAETAETLTDYWAEPSEPAIVRKKNGRILTTPDIIQITFTTGWVVSELPGTIIEACKKLVETMYEHREDFVVGRTISHFPWDSDDLLGGLINHRV
jgi:uncharacterized phiE125 gp8 family phage protein